MTEHEPNVWRMAYHSVVDAWATETKILQAVHAAYADSIAGEPDAGFNLWRHLGDIIGDPE